MTTKQNKMANDSSHWITTEEGNHILISGEGEVIGGVGGKLNGKKLENVQSKSKDVSNTKNNSSQEDKKISAREMAILVQGLQSRGMSVSEARKQIEEKKNENPESFFDAVGKLNEQDKTKKREVSVPRTEEGEKINPKQFLWEKHDYYKSTAINANLSGGGTGNRKTINVKIYNDGDWDLSVGFEQKPRTMSGSGGEKEAFAHLPEFAKEATYFDTKEPNPGSMISARKLLSLGPAEGGTAYEFETGKATKGTSLPESMHRDYTSEHAEKEQARRAQIESERKYLNVPFAEKDTAKKRGARWDPERKKWYLPKGVELHPSLEKYATDAWIPCLDKAYDGWNDSEEICDFLCLAFDKSARKFDADGRMHIDRSHISKATVNPYYGKEIPGYEDLGLDAEKVYKLFRPPEELEKAAPTFARLPILKEHVPIAADSPRQDLIIGAIGSDVEFNQPYLDADLSFWDSSAIAGIETDAVKELSCAYRYVPVMEPGEFEGQAYDGRMTDIQGNHLALVEVGRAGSDVVVADQNPFEKEKTMRMSKLGKALFAALSAASPVLAADSALPALVGQANRKTFKKAEVKGKLLALDATLNPEQLDSVIDALLGVEEEPKPMEPMVEAAGDESPAEKIKALLAGKVDEEVIDEIIKLIAEPAEDAFPEKKEGEEKPMKKEEVKAAMDELRKSMRDAAAAAREVRGVVGDVTMDSAEEIYGFALDHMGIDHKGVTGPIALRALFNVAQKGHNVPVHVAQDSAGASQMFPGLDRFHNA